jgi:hypothetical protein
MADTRSAAERSAALNRAQTHFNATEKREQLVRDEIARERAATDAKTAKLRALRLAKEEADRVAAANAPAPAAQTKPAAKRKRAITVR